MRLSANVITNVRYYKAGTDIPDDLLSDALRRYAVSDVQQQRRDADAIEANFQLRFKQKVKLYVRRGYAFQLAEGEQLIVGEPFYRKRPIGGFEKIGSVVAPNAL